MLFSKREGGFSLIEVLIATVVLCTIIPLTSYFINSMKTNKKTELQQTANYVAQKYMEEYKAKSLSDYSTMGDDSTDTFTDTETGLYVSIRVLLDEAHDPSVGSMNVTGYFGSSIDIKLGSSSPYSGATAGDTLVLRVLDTGTAEEMQLEKTDGTILKTTELETVTPICADRLIFINVKDDPQLTLNVINELPSSRWVVFKINEANTCPNFILNKDGKVGLTTDAVTTEKGARITVTVKKDIMATEILAKATQARKI